MYFGKENEVNPFIINTHIKQYRYVSRMSRNLCRRVCFVNRNKKLLSTFNDVRVADAHFSQEELTLHREIASISDARAELLTEH